jgi:deoxyribose-phosphate aldolase
VIAFPFGVTSTEVKAAEMRASAAKGADEADFVINISLLKSRDDAAVEAEMQYLSDACRTLGVVSKFIIETGSLTNDEKLRACKIANRVRPDFVKTSTGYGASGATAEDVKLLRSVLLPEIQIKASGGIRSHREALALVQAGASRIGTSSGIVILEESRKV